MKTLEVNISLDPVNDGAAIINVKDIKVKEESALIIATNGQKRRADISETSKIMAELKEVCQGEFMGKSPYIMIINGNKVLKLETGSFFIGSALIMKDEGDGKHMGSLNDEDIEKAEAEFRSRLVTLTANGMEYSAYQLQ